MRDEEQEPENGVSAGDIAAWGARPEHYGADGDRGSLGRIIGDFGALYRIVVEEAGGGGTLEVSADLPGAWRESGQDRPQVGDFVRVANVGRWRIVSLLPRRSVLQRLLPGPVTASQVMAANIDRVFILTAMTEAANLMWLERAVSLTWDGGANPVVVGTKADIAPDPAGFVADVMAGLPGVEVCGVSAMTGDGVDALGTILRPGDTGVLLGKSGAGKSTLLNALAPAAQQRVEAVRDDDGRGRHTTTHRQLFQLPTGALLIDVPGIREMGRWDAADVGPLFQDIAAWADGCRFSDCRHQGEPGCAIQEALDTGALAPEHWENFQKMAREQAFQERKRSQAARAAQGALYKARTRALRQRAHWDPKMRDPR